MGTLLQHTDTRQNFTPPGGVLRLLGRGSFLGCAVCFQWAISWVCFQLGKTAFYQAENAAFCFFGGWGFGGFVCPARSGGRFGCFCGFSGFWGFFCFFCFCGFCGLLCSGLGCVRCCGVCLGWAFPFGSGCYGLRFAPSLRDASRHSTSLTRLLRASSGFLVVVGVM